jgi:hypothetical protein
MVVAAAAAAVVVVATAVAAAATDRQAHAKTCFDRQQRNLRVPFFLPAPTKIDESPCIWLKKRIHNARADVSAGTCTQGLR